MRRPFIGVLDIFGFEWDGPVLYQSARGEAYEAALAALRGHVYGCGCSRKDDCNCRITPPAVARAWRFRAEAGGIAWHDRCLGAQIWPVDDFVVKRADGLFAYQLAVVVDDAAQGVTEVVRGADLLDSTPRQIALQRALGYATPSYLHLPVVSNARGEKLSKQTNAPALLLDDAAGQLAEALRYLGQAPPGRVSLGEAWRWARAHWDEGRIPVCPL